MQRYAIVAILVLLAILWIDVTRSEPFEPDDETLAMEITRTLAQRGVRFAPNGVMGVTARDVTIGPAEYTNMMGVVFGSRPAFVSRVTARLDIKTQGGDTIITPTFTIDGHGETRAASRRDAQVGIERVVARVESRLSS
jgi:hypothetical protein